MDGYSTQALESPLDNAGFGPARHWQPSQGLAPSNPFSPLRGQNDWFSIPQAAR